MKRTKRGTTAFVWVLTGLIFSGMLYGQSVADLARQERARRTGEGKVFTNDTISTARAGEATTPAATPTAEPAQKPAGAAETAAAKDQEAQAKKPEGKSTAELEKEYREKFAHLREALAFEEKKLDVMQRELNLMQMQYYSDPNVALREQRTRGEINQRTQEMQDQKAAVDKAKKAIEDLEEELRRKSLPTGWAR